MIELKNWKAYTNEDKQLILQHWWYYYGKCPYNLEEYQSFDELIKSNIDEVFKLVVINYAFGISNEPLIKAFRENEVGKLLLSLKKYELNTKMDEDEKWLKIEEELLSKVINSLNKLETTGQININYIVTKIKEKSLYRIKTKRKTYY